MNVSTLSDAAIVEILKTASEKRTAVQKRDLLKFYRDRDAGLKRINDQLRAVDKKQPRYRESTAMLLVASTNAPKTFVHIRGDFLNHGEEVRPGALSALQPFRPRGESKETLAAYGVDRDGAGLKTYRGGGVDAFKSFARNCLLARRMIERGVRFVSIHHASWDHHNDLDSDLSFNCKVVDQPIGALLKDLKQRGLLDSTLVVWASEFGRTPLGENRVNFKSVTGRDHHPFAFSTWMAGGGVKGGQVIGETDELGWGVTKDPVSVNDFHATILHLFGLNHEKLTYRFQGRDFRLTDVAGKVVDKILS